MTTQRMLGWTLGSLLLGTAILVGCGGGSTSLKPPAQQASIQTGPTGQVALTVDFGKYGQSILHSPKFIGSGVCCVNYTLNADAANPNGAVTKSGQLTLFRGPAPSPAPSATAVSPAPSATAAPPPPPPPPNPCSTASPTNSYTCTIVVVPGNYTSLQLTVGSFRSCYQPAPQPSITPNGTPPPWSPPQFPQPQPTCPAAPSPAPSPAFYPVGGGTGTAASGDIVVAAGASTALTVTINPVYALVWLNVNPQPAASGNPVFWADGVAQTLTAIVWQSDPLMNIISTANGPVNNWPAVTVSADDTHVTPCAAITAAPNSPAAFGNGPGGPGITTGGSPCSLTYDGILPTALPTASPNGSFKPFARIAAVSAATAGPNGQPPAPPPYPGILIPYIYMLGPQSITFSDVGPQFQQTVNITEVNALTAPFPGETNLNVTTDCGTHATISPPPGPNVGMQGQGPGGSPTMALNLNIYANDTGIASCSVTARSNVDPNPDASSLPALHKTFTINFPGSLGVGALDKLRKGTP